MKRAEKVTVFGTILLSPCSFGMLRFGVPESSGLFAADRECN